jgi:hypothetical protein
MADLFLAAGVSTWGPRALWLALALVGAILVGAVIVALVDRWRKQPLSDQPSASEQLAHFRQLYEGGDISQGEFDRICGALEKQLRAEVNLPPMPAPEAGPSTGSPPDGTPGPESTSPDAP